MTATGMHCLLSRLVSWGVLVIVVGDGRGCPNQARSQEVGEKLQFQESYSVSGGEVASAFMQVNRPDARTLTWA
jgi:hypothetical protein